MPDIPRTRYGWPLVPSPFPDGDLKPHRRPSGITKKIDDTFALERWQERMAIKGIALRPDLLALAHALDPDDNDEKKALNDVVTQAKAAARSGKGANVGTALHSYCRQWLAGNDVTPLEDHAPAVEAFKRCIEAHGIEPVLLEQFVVWPEMLVAGSCDIYARYQGRTVVLDIKTGQSNPVDYSLVSYAGQLAAYSHATHRWDGETATPLDDVDTGTAYLIWLPSGRDTCELVEVDTARGRRFVEIALEVDAAHKDKSIGKVIEAPKVTARPRSLRDPVSDGFARCYATIAELMEAGTSADAIKECWPPDVPQLNAGVGAHTVDTIAAIEGALELARMGARLVVATTDDIDAMVHRLRALPEDLYAAVEVESKALEPPVPHLRSGRVTDGDLARLAELVERAEHTRAERVMRLTNALSPLSADQAASIVDWATEQRMGVAAGVVPALESLDDLEAERAIALAETYADDTPLEALLEPYPKRDVIRTAKEVAARHDLGAPKSTAAVASNRVLAALTIHQMKEATA